MATTLWSGATDGDPSNNANWSGNAPANGDTAIIDSGSVDIDGVDMSGVTPALIVIGPNYTGNIGTGTGDMWQINATKLVIAGGGAAQYIDGTFGTLIVKRVGTGTQNLYYAGNVTLALFHKGTIQAVSDTTTTMYVDALDSTNANLTVDVLAATVTNMYLRYGNVDLTGAGTITTCYMDNGTLDVTAGTLVTLHQRAGTATWQTTNALTTAVIYGGTFDASGNVQAKTITNLTAYGEAILNLDNGSGNITLTNDLINRGYGVDITWPTATTEAYS